MAVMIVALLGALLLVAGGDTAPAGGLRHVVVVSLERADQVAFVDLARGRLLRRVAVAFGPHSLDATGDGRVVAVTSPPSGRVTILEGRLLRVRRVLSGFRSPHDIKLTRRSHRLRRGGGPRDAGRARHRDGARAAAGAGRCGRA
jgi:hypothetical protein